MRAAMFTASPNTSFLSTRTSPTFSATRMRNGSAAPWTRLYSATASCMAMPQRTPSVGDRKVIRNASPMVLMRLPPKREISGTNRPVKSRISALFSCRDWRAVRSA